jgi:hypothetical protein
MGAVVGAVLGTLAMAAVYLALRIPAVESSGLTTFFIGPGGFLSLEGDSPWAWTAAPLAAGFAGWLRADRALAGDHLAGTLMGYLTYFVGVAIGPAVVFAPFLIRDLAGAPVTEAMRIEDLVGSYAMLLILGSFILLPLLVACAAGGIAWAAALRRVVRVSGGLPQPLIPRRPDIRWLVVATIVLGIGWFLFASFILSFSGVGEFD